MKIISSNSTYQVFPNGIETHDSLPNKTFRVHFSKNSGFSLEEVKDFSNGDEKIYGTHEKKVQKILRSFESFERSLGVILSGDKGIGKSLFIRLLAEESIKRGIPVIIVDEENPGIEGFIDSIEQEVLVLFDEFEKVFRPNQNYNPQDQLLSLFDGMSQNKRIYAITVNKLEGLNEFMLNRPGRFHYHLRFEYPTSTEVHQYLNDNTKNVDEDEIKKVIEFSSKVKLNFDCLRAIAFELNLGESFADAIKDLNILDVNENKYNIKVVFNDGSSDVQEYGSINMFSKTQISAYNYSSSIFDYVHFNPSMAIAKNGALYADMTEAHVSKTDENDEDEQILSNVKEIIITPKLQRNFHYNAL